jgi:hypothetical protein
MTSEMILRMECLKLAAQVHVKAGGVVGLAAEFEEFVLLGDPIKQTWIEPVDDDVQVD